MAWKNDKERVRQAFATRFRKALLELGYTASEQKVMRQLFGVSGQAVSKWAEGESLPTASRMPQVAGVLGVRRAWLQDGEEPMRPSVGRVAEPTKEYTASAPGLALSATEIKLVLQYRNLTPPQKNAVRQMAVLFTEAAKRRKPS